MEAYKKRIVDELLVRKLASKGAVLVQGPKWCGKTTTAARSAASILYMTDPGEFQRNMELVTLDPKQLLVGATPRLIDEWQVAPPLWDAVRFEVDQRHKRGQFILTGSAVPPSTSLITHSGVGRFAKLTMRPMSLYESLNSTGEVSLGDLFNAPEQIRGINRATLHDIAFLTCRGGWPGATDNELTEEIALEQARDYYDMVVDSDISRVDGVSRDPQRVKTLMRSYARHQATQANLSVIRADMMTNDTDSLNEDTIAGYINALRQIFVIEDLPAWNPNLRSKTAIRTSATRFFVDPSIATAALGLGPDDLINDLNTFGLLFETLCVRDLRVYADKLDGEVYHFRDARGLECDAVVHLRNGRYGLIEIKLGGDKLIEEAAGNLKKLAGKIDTARMKSPAFSMILTAVGTYAYRRGDGVYIVPVGCLRD
jgi:predicted AAA+ superfamily ATPase